MPRRLFAVVVFVGCSLVIADDKSVVPPEPECECRFDDGSTMRLTVGTSTVTVQTKFGKMTVPLAEVRKMEMGFRYPEGVEGKVRVALSDLASPDFRTRESAQKTLIGCGEYAVPLVKAGVKNDVPEVADRCAFILKTITATLPESKSDPVMEDVITTDEMVIRGKITSDSFKAKSKYFGETTVKLLDVRELRPLSGRFIGTFPLDATKFAAAGWKTFFDTGLDVEKGQPIEITATGKVDLNAQNPKQTVVGPNGGNTQVPGPGMHGMDKRLGGGLQPPGGPVVAWEPGSGTPIASCTTGALYGRIGESGKLFKIGESYKQAKATEAGRLYLIIAPSAHGVAKGEFDVKVNLGK